MACLKLDYTVKESEIGGWDGISWTGAVVRFRTSDSEGRILAQIGLHIGKTDLPSTAFVLPGTQH